MNGKVSVSETGLPPLPVFPVSVSSNSLHVLTDTVKDNDGIIDGVTDNGKHAGNKCITYRNTDQCITCQHNKYIVYQCDNRTTGKTDILETEPDIKQHENTCNDHVP